MFLNILFIINNNHIKIDILYLYFNSFINTFKFIIIIYFHIILIKYKFVQIFENVKNF